MGTATATEWSRPLSSCVANWAATLAIFLILALHISIEIHDDNPNRTRWTSIALVVDACGLLVQVYLIAALGSAMAIGAAVQPPDERRSVTVSPTEMV